MYKILSNSSEAFYSSVFSVLGSKMFFPSRTIYFGDVPIISALNGFDSMYWVNIYLILFFLINQN